jgi:hypothetical protein
MDAGELTNLGAWAILSGALLPWLIGILVQQSWSRGAKSAVAFAVALADALVVYGFDHGFHFDDAHFVITAASVYLTAQVTYQNLWKPTLGVGGADGISPISEPVVEEREEVKAAVRRRRG